MMEEGEWEEEEMCTNREGDTKCRDVIHFINTY